MLRFQAVMPCPDANTTSNSTFPPLFNNFPLSHMPFSVMPLLFQVAVIQQFSSYCPSLTKDRVLGIPLQTLCGGHGLPWKFSSTRGDHFNLSRFYDALLLPKIALQRSTHPGQIITRLPHLPHFHHPWNLHFLMLLEKSFYIWYLTHFIVLQCLPSIFIIQSMPFPLIQSPSWAKCLTSTHHAIAQ